MSESTGLRTKFYREDDTSPGTFVEIAQIASITPPQPEREVAEVDELDPPGDVKKKLPGIIDPGEVTVTLNFDPTNNGHLDLEQDFRDATSHQYRIKLPNDFGWTFTGIVTAYSPQEISSGDVVQAEVTITLSGVYTFGQITP
jgi:hypothetical protein